jgi:hypothetical protein
MLPQANPENLKKNDPEKSGPKRRLEMKMEFLLY